MAVDFNEVDKYWNTVRDKFIDEEIIQKIYELPDEQKSIELPAVNGWFQGNSFKFTKEYSNNSECNIHLTSLIMTKLHKQGFHFDFKMKSWGNEFRNGEGTVRVDWSNAKF